MIGGEFPIAVTDILNVKETISLHEDCYAYASGRAALYQILKYLKETKAKIASLEYIQNELNGIPNLV